MWQKSNGLADLIRRLSALKCGLNYTVFISREFKSSFSSYRGQQFRVPLLEYPPRNTWKKKKIANKLKFASFCGLSLWFVCRLFTCAARTCLFLGLFFFWRELLFFFPCGLELWPNKSFYTGLQRLVSSRGMESRVYRVFISILIFALS